MSFIHASAVVLPCAQNARETQNTREAQNSRKKCGVLLVGESGCGKSSLAYRLISTHSAQLVGDDRIMISRDRTHADTPLLMRPAEPLAGLLELRGLGVVRFDFTAPAPLALVVELVARACVPRIAPTRFWQYADCQVPLLALHSFDIDTPALIQTAANTIARTGFCETGIYDAP